MTTNRQVPYLIGDNKKQSYSGRLHQRLDEAMQEGTEVQVRLPWGGLSGVPVYLDDTCVEIVYVHVYEPEDDDELDDEVSRRTVWLVRLEEISAVSFVSESWSKERLEKLFVPEKKGENTSVQDLGSEDSID
ncbi:hypothetical protein IQ260_22330 [Leptolyngbya cf. ectocarpi LEGE 11479]|uniref:Uncharacterized protein n=1 Tax=Leptolyngbya cf. ectocarpi LEGE 11479 TaxID=1828722 RepID=A0A928ZXN6_LEPEC|nr:hypothetical protein [Leptolyngbya ectocarpi]MBE9069386.1 hypothetical protein [Leptolyngbya cf. ectocarpi LEGE 11479]